MIPSLTQIPFPQNIIKQRKHDSCHILVLKSNSEYAGDTLQKIIGQANNVLMLI